MMDKYFVEDAAGVQRQNPKDSGQVAATSRSLS
jgi:hypothetical protein